jgi:hypothetical protein
VAIIGTKGTGIWEYRPVGGDWTLVGKVTTGKALFLNAADEIRFTADAAAVPHTASLSFKAWDKTKFAVGSRGPATGTIVSKETEVLTVAVGNTAPVLTPGSGITLPPVSLATGKPSAPIAVKTLLLGTSVSDTPRSLRGIAIVFADNATAGHWEYSLGGNIWREIGAVSADSALLLSDTAKIRFVPNGVTGTATIQFKAWDRTAGQAGDRIDTDLPLNSFSTAIEEASIDVTA